MPRKRNKSVDEQSVSVVVEDEVVPTTVKSCVCKHYTGEAFNCPQHDARMLCPVCHCVDTEIEIPGALPPMRDLRCRVCGTQFQRNMVSGEIWHF